MQRFSVYFCKILYMFQTGFFRPSSGAQNCTYSVRYLSVYAVLSSWWRTEKTRLKHVQRLTEINKLWNVASCWLYSANILAMRRHMNVKLRYSHDLCTWRVHFLRHQVKRSKIRYVFVNKHNGMASTTIDMCSYKIGLQRTWLKSNSPA